MLIVMHSMHPSDKKSYIVELCNCRYFEKQFELAHTTKLPMFLHMRAAAEDFCDIVERNKQRSDL